MYIKLTTYCNMQCAHCCDSCSPSRGKHMDERTFIRTLDLCAEHGATPYIGGGEPTVHPKFWQFLGLILGRAHEFEMEMLGMHTNGKRKADALALAALAKRGVLGVTLSRDSFHEPIDHDVVEAFTKTGSSGSMTSSWWERDTPSRRDPHDLRFVVDGANKSVVAQGRARNITGARTDCCVCEDLQVDPDGVIWACGCERTQFGTVWKPRLPDNAFEYACWERERAAEERMEKLKSDALRTELVRGVSADLIAM